VTYYDIMLYKRKRKYLTEKLASVDADIVRYDGEKADITKDAKNLEAQQSFYMEHSQSLGMAAMLLQIAIMLSAISALLKKPHTWYLGLACGVAGLFFMIKGLYL